ncbi:hypothetical protein [Saccharothrix yanglingensis]|uniref:Uncharacterized protein n=1 Tax=Saccharothrix yanglingensis TaxID=659496 RepID=A0ABU0X7E0_9PSEU|nr:hypothetical protein [Saccharothrix yanglingensis]MDQ2588037.1 hypothetical protein [Saccharothrix yanglingensis]
MALIRSHEELAAGLVAATPTHDDRAPELLLRWARVALGFGGEMVPLVPIASVWAKNDPSARQTSLAEHDDGPDVVTVHRDDVHLLAAS